MVLKQVWRTQVPLIDRMIPFIHLTEWRVTDNCFMFAVPHQYGVLMVDAGGWLMVDSLYTYNSLCLQLHDSDPVYIVHRAALLPHQITHTDN